MNAKLMQSLAMTTLLALAACNPKPKTIEASNCTWQPDPHGTRKQVMVCLASDGTSIHADTTGIGGGGHLATVDSVGIGGGGHLRTLASTNCTWQTDPTDPTKEVLVCDSAGTTVKVYGKR
jgi:hypothetical protein